MDQDVVVVMDLTALDPERRPALGEAHVRLLRCLDALLDEEFELQIVCDRALVAAHPDLVGRFEVRVPPRWAGATSLGYRRVWLPRVLDNVDLVHQVGGRMAVGADEPHLITVLDADELSEVADAVEASQAPLPGICCPTSSLQRAAHARRGNVERPVYLLPLHDDAEASAIALRDAYRAIALRIAS